MSDLLRIVSFNAGGRPVVELDIENGSTYRKIRDSLEIKPGQKRPILSQQSRRYGGSRQVAETHENGELKGNWLISGASADACIQNLEALLARMEDAAPGRYIEFRPDGATRSVFYELRGTGAWSPNYRWVQFVGALSINAEISFPIAPVGLLPSMDAFDDFAVDSIGDYTFDLGGEAVVGSYSTEVLADSPLQYLRLGETSGTNADDATANNRDGTYTGAYTLGQTGALAGDSDKSVLLSGGYVSTTYDPGFAAGSLTFEGWAYRNDTTTRGVLVASDHGQTFFLAADAGGSNMHFEARGGFGDINSWAGVVPTAQWFHWALTFSDATDTAELFINGASQGTRPQSQSAQAGLLRYGGVVGTDVWNGKLDEVAVYSGILSSARILAHYNAGSTDQRVSQISVSGGQMVPSSATEKRLYHSARGYQVLDAQATRKYTPGATIAGFKGGVQLCRSAANTYIDVYVDDDGTNSRLRIDAVIAGARTNRASVNLAARISNGTPFWVRGRREGQIIFAEHFTAEPTPMGAPTTQSPSGGAGYTLSGGEQTSLVAGYMGAVWIPQNTGARLDDWRDEPFTYRNQTLPQKIALGGSIPGDAPALFDAHVTPSGGTAPVWALLAWTKRARSPMASTVVPFGIIEAESGTDLSTWAVTADVDYAGGSGLQATASGAGTAAAMFAIDPSALDPDDFALGDLDVEVWARIETDGGLVSPKLVLSARPTAGTAFGAERFTNEFGSQGKLLTRPSSGLRFRFVRLGVLPLASFPLEPVSWKLRVAASWAAGSTGIFGLDRLLVVRARQRAAGPTGKANDANYPKFVSTTSEARKIIRSDLSGRIASPPAAPFPDSGLGGSVLELPPGQVDAAVKLSSLVPDDPTSDTTSEVVSQSATVHFAVQPRTFLLRGS